MIVYYKVSDVPSTNPPPVHADDKRALVQMCLKSFVEAYSDTKPKVVFICDNCPKDYEDMIKAIFPFESEFHFTELGNFGASRYQYELANKQDEDILFQEDDYIQKPNIGEKMDQGLAELGLVSPYDHANFYIDQEMHSPVVELRLVGDTHWRTTERNTMTFAVKNEVFKRNCEIFYKHGNKDSDVWEEIDAQLYTPIPSFATHMVGQWVAPSVDWKKLWKTQT